MMRARLGSNLGRVGELVVRTVVAAPPTGRALERRGAEHEDDKADRGDRVPALVRPEPVVAAGDAKARQKVKDRRQHERLGLQLRRQRAVQRKQRDANQNVDVQPADPRAPFAARSPGLLQNGKTSAMLAHTRARVCVRGTAPYQLRPGFL